MTALTDRPQVSLEEVDRIRADLPYPTTRTWGAWVTELVDRLGGRVPDDAQGRSWRGLKFTCGIDLAPAANNRISDIEHTLFLHPVPVYQRPDWLGRQV